MGCSNDGIGSGVAVCGRVSEGGAPDPQRAGFTGSVALHLRHRLAGWPRESFLRSTDLRGGACGSEPRIAGLRAGRVPKCGGRTLFPGRRNGGCCGRGEGRLPDGRVPACRAACAIVRPASPVPQAFSVAAGSMIRSTSPAASASCGESQRPEPLFSAIRRVNSSGVRPERAA